MYSMKIFKNNYVSCYFVGEILVYVNCQINIILSAHHNYIFLEKCYMFVIA
jgi:hypothetical protein